MHHIWAWQSVWYMETLPQQGPKTKIQNCSSAASSSYEVRTGNPTRFSDVELWATPTQVFHNFLWLMPTHFMKMWPISTRDLTPAYIIWQGFDNAYFVLSKYKDLHQTVAVNTGCEQLGPFQTANWIWCVYNQKALWMKNRLFSLARIISLFKLHC